MTWREKIIARILLTVAVMLASESDPELRTELRDLKKTLEVVTIAEAMPRVKIGAVE